jgi:hypothetical protein
MTIFGAISAAFEQPTGHYANLLVVTLFIWISVFSNTWSVIPWTVAAEISSAPLREKTLALASWSGFGVGLAVGFVVPYSESSRLELELTLCSPEQGLRESRWQDRFPLGRLLPRLVSNPSLERTPI